MKLTVKLFEIFFNEFSSKKFFNSLKLTIKIFRNVFSMKSPVKIFRNFFSMKLTVKIFQKFFSMNSAVKNFSIV